MLFTVWNESILKIRFLIFVFIGVSAFPVSAQTLRIAVASNFNAPMKAITQAFEQQSGYKAQLIFGSSGKFYAQIMNEAPFDVFLSADKNKPAMLERNNKIVTGSRVTYASGRLILWSKVDGFIQSNADRLKSNSFRKLAIANPRLAPYGEAALQALKSLGVWTEVQPKAVMGENIGQAFQFVASGNADLGLISLSQVSRDGQLKSGSGWVIPGEFYDPILQQAVILKRARDNKAAFELMRFLRSDRAQAIAHSYGYQKIED